MPSQEVQEELLKAVVEDDSETLTRLAHTYGAVDSEKLATDLQGAGMYLDPKTPERIRAVFARRDRRLQTVHEIVQVEEANAAENGSDDDYGAPRRNNS